MSLGLRGILWRRAALFGASILFLGPPGAGATPAFARKYGVSCTTCHASAYPEINPFGRLYKENGYQLPDGAEEIYRNEASLAPGAAGERLSVWRNLPLALRALSTTRVPTSASSSARNDLDFRMFNALFLLGGGSVTRDVSFFVAASLEPNAALHHASVGFHNLLFGEGALNARAGQFLLLDFLRPEHRSLTQVGNAATTVAVGLNPTTLDTNHLGLSLYGRTFNRRLFYNAALVQGAQGDDALDDLDSHKDLFGQIQLTLIERHTAGLFAYRGRTQITDQARAVVVRFTDPFFVVGSDAEVNLGPMTLYGCGVFGRHDNPTGLGEGVDYWALRAEADLSLTRETLAVIRYDRVISSDDETLETEFLTTHATYLLMTNMKLSAEYIADVADFEQSTVYFMLDLAL